MVELRLAWRSIWQVRYQSKYAFFCYGCLFSAAGNSRKRKIRFLWISWFRFFLFSLCRSKKKFDRFVEVVVKVGKADLIIQFADWPVFFFFFLSSCFSFSPRLHCFAASARSRRPSIDGYNFSISYKTSVFVRSWLSLSLPPPLSLFYFLGSPICWKSQCRWWRPFPLFSLKVHLVLRSLHHIYVSIPF